MRVVSLLPSATEICFALDVEPVGVSHECDYPPAARELPAVNELRIDDSGSSAGINSQVADAEGDEGVSAIDRDRLATLEPDVVLTQGVCDVCAVDRVLVREAVESRSLDADVVTLDVHSIDDLFRAIETVGAACGRPGRATGLIEDLGDRIEEIETRAVDASERETRMVEGGANTTNGSRTARERDRPRVAVLDWLDPVMVAGHWVPELVDVAGGRYGLEQPGAHSRPREWTEVCEYDPQILIVSPCGFELPQIRKNLTDLTERPGWETLSAVRNGRVSLVDGHHYVNRAGPRLVDTLEYLAATISPDRFDSPPRTDVQRLDAAGGTIE